MDNQATQNFGYADNPAAGTQNFGRADNQATATPDSKEPGVFITFEGGDGAGKSTHMSLLAEALRHSGREVVPVREPGGTIIGEQLRKTALDAGNYLMAYECELMIYEAARAQLVFQTIKPALARGAVILCDRFCDSTIAYQGYGRGLDLDFIKQANDFACQGITPDRTILMLTGGDAEVGLDRATQHKHADRMEMAGNDFHQRVNDAYLMMAEEDPNRIRLVVSNDTKAATAAKVFAALSDLFPWMADPAICNEAFFEDLLEKRENMEYR